MAIPLVSQSPHFMLKSVPLIYVACIVSIIVSIAS